MLVSTRALEKYIFLMSWLVARAQNILSIVGLDSEEEYENGAFAVLIWFALIWYLLWS